MSDEPNPSEPGWAGDYIKVGEQQCLIFERDGRVHFHDADTGGLLHVHETEQPDPQELRELVEVWRARAERAMSGEKWATFEACADELEELLNG